MGSSVKGLRPRPGEAADAFIRRGQSCSAADCAGLQPQEGEALGEYLFRLRHTNQLELDQVETLLQDFPPQVTVTCSDLWGLEGGSTDLINEPRLRVVATLYGVPQEWLVNLAQSYENLSNDVAISVERTQADRLVAVMTQRSPIMDSLDENARRLLEETFRELIAAASRSSTQSDEAISQNAD